MPHCDEVGHDFRELTDDCGEITIHCVRTLHAENNAIIQAAKNGVSLDGSTMYLTMTPCRRCAMMIINAGIKKVICSKRYKNDKESLKILRQAKIPVIIKSEAVQLYRDLYNDVAKNDKKP